ncbi:hypothetical protein [Tsuneonella suprasediminis]|nr:hypothetical protein [Tsuneonella suprasediminis]
MANARLPDAPHPQGRLAARSGGSFAARLARIAAPDGAAESQYV